MIHFLLIVCAFAEGFLLWFLVALIRESRHLAPRTGKAGRTRRGPVSRSGELIPMNPGTTQDENAGKAMRKRTVLAVLAHCCSRFHCLGGRRGRRISARARTG
jgi:hypothetical protein